MRFIKYFSRKLLNKFNIQNISHYFLTITK